MTHPTMHTPEANRANALLQDGRLTEAISVCKAALRKMPRDPELRYILAQAHTRSNFPADALPHLERLVREYPDGVAFRVELANALDGAGRPEEALEAVEHALRLRPDHDFALRIRVKILRGIGRGRQAWEELAPRLHELPNSVHVALSLGFVVPEDADPAPVLKRLRDVATDESVSDPNRRTAWYTIARIQQRAGNHDEAFDAATRANALIPDGLPDRHHASMFDGITPDLVSTIEPARIDGSGVVLVCGMPRSGTTLTERILAAHPDAASAGEFNALPLAVNEALEAARTQGLAPAELSTRIAKGYLKALRARAGDRRAKTIIDKMPTNHLLLAPAARLLPGVRVVRCVRDPRDIALSCYMQDFAQRHTYRARLDTLADELLLHDRAARRWRDELEEQYLESALEDLVADPDNHARRLVAHAGLEWNDACLRFHEQDAHVRTASTEQVRSGINASGIGRWKHYERHLAPLIERIAPILPNQPPPN